MSTPSSPSRRSGRKYSRDEIDEANDSYAYAFQLLGLITFKEKKSGPDAGPKAQFWCPFPKCRETTPHGKLFKGLEEGQDASDFPDGKAPKPGWACMKCRAHNTDTVCPVCNAHFKRNTRECKGGVRGSEAHAPTRTVKLDAVGLMQFFGKLSFNEAVSRLRGEASGDFTPPEPIDASLLEMSSGSTAEADVEMIEVYEYILNSSPYVSTEAAQDYYAARGIDRSVVARIGFTYVSDVEAFKADLIEVFGYERLVAAGLVKDRGEDAGSRRYWWILSDRHPALEFQFRKGRPRTMQARASAEYRAEVAARKKRMAAKLGREPNYSELYDGVLPKALNLLGVAEQPGFGEVLLEWFADTHPGATVALVEGGPDYAAGRTLGLPVCGVAGTGAALSPEALAALARLKLVLCFDGDEGGQRSAIERAEELEWQGVAVVATHRSSCLAATFRYPEDERLLNLGELLERECRCYERADDGSIAVDDAGEPTPAPPDGLDLSDCLTRLVEAGLWPAPDGFETSE